MIRRCLLGVLFWLISAPVWAADPFRAGAGPSAVGQAAAASDVGWFGSLIGEIALMQRGLNSAISGHLRDLAAGGSLSAMMAVLGLSFAYGVLHAAGPGHGKTVVAAYFVARKEAVWRGLAIGSAISFIQALVAVLLVGALGIFLKWSRIDITNSAASVETVSYGLIFLLGCWLLWAAVTGRHHHHHHHTAPSTSPAHTHDLAHDHGHHHGHGDHGHGDHGHSDHGHGDHAHHDHAHHDHAHHDHGHHDQAGKDQRSTIGIVVAAGLTPCASAIIVMLFALAQQVFLAGILAVMTMAVGMAITVSAIGVATIYARRLVARFADGGESNERLERILGAVGAIILMIFSGLMTLGAGVQLAG